MARAVYSTRFAAVVISGALNLYTVPAGYIAVVRSVDFLATGASPGIFAWGLAAGGIYFAGATGLTTDNAYHWEGRQVFNAGDTIKAITATITGQLAVSGYLLTTP